MGAQRRKWLATGGIGALFVGTGLSCAIESGFLKHEGALWYVWALAGTVSLAILMIGLILLIKAGHMGEDLKKDKNRSE